MVDEVSAGATPQASPEERLVQFFASKGQKSAPTAPKTTIPVQAEPEQESEEVSAEAQPQEQASEETQETDAPEQDEHVSDEAPEGYVELEHLGKKWTVPPDLKSAFDENRKMATRSAMELAPVRKALEVEKIAMQAAKVVDGEIKEISAELAKLNSYKEQAKKLDWSQLTLDQKVDLDRELRQIDGQVSELERRMSSKLEEAKGRFGELIVQSVQQTEQFMATKVPGWDTEKGNALRQYGAELGIPTEKLLAGWFSDPVATHVMWKAQQWDRLQSSRPTVTNKARNAPPVIRPASNQVQKSVAASNYQKVRQNLKKTGSLEDFAAALLARKG